MPKAPKRGRAKSSRVVTRSRRNLSPREDDIESNESEIIEPLSNPMSSNMYAIRSNMSTTSNRSDSTFTKNLGNGLLKFAKELIPEFDGSNMSVNLFVEQCKTAANLLEPHEIPYLLILIRNKIKAPARRYIQERIGLTLDDLYRTLQGIYSLKEDSSQLSQELAVIHRKANESIADYGNRVTELLYRITAKIMEKNPGENGFIRCKEYSENAVRNFIRGLDKDTLNFMQNKFPPNLDVAIEWATEADTENKSWSRVHQNEQETNDKKCVVAHINSNENGEKRSKKNVQCFHCKENGHIRSNCPKRNKSHSNKSNENSNETRKANESHTNKTCDYCTFKGHLREECHLKRKHDEEIELRKRKAASANYLNSQENRKNGANAVQTSSNSSSSVSVYSSAQENNLQTLK